MSDATIIAAPVATRARYVREYAVSGRHGPTALATLLPPRSDPDYLWVLVELVRADLEYRRTAESAASVEDYRSTYPELFDEPEIVRALTSGSDVDLTHTPPPAGELEFTRAVTITPAPHWAGAATAPTPGVTLPMPPTKLPSTGESFLGFNLLAELGTGAFGKVFLAEQSELSDRPVALKITTRPTREPQRLARLRHTNVVPIYSVHDRPPLQAVCMPYLGRKTLADLIRAYRVTGTYPRTSHPAPSTIVAQRTTVGSRSAPTSSPTCPHSLAPTPHPETPAGPAEVAFVVELIARVADGLAHAHEQGILHLDLKPANVLYADDGQPLLLDFNLAFDVRAQDREKAGGTLPYMAPEQLEEYRDRGPTRVDHRTDLFALGVIFYELLTGRHPYLARPDRRADLTEMIAARRAGPPPVRPFNPAVTPAVESIVHKLLAPNPDDRYQATRELATDLERHRQSLPLQYAANRSLVERATKWRRRNPRLATYAILVIAVLAVAGTGTAAYRHGEARQQAEELTRGRSTRDAFARLRIDLTSPEDFAGRTATIEQGQALMARYGLPEQTDLASRLAILPEADRIALLDDLGELGALMAHAEWLNGRGRTPEVRAAAAERARVWNRAASACFAGRTEPAALAAQRNRLDTGADEPLADRAGPTRLDLFLAGAERLALGRNKEAIAPLETLVMAEPGHYGGQFALAYCLQRCGDRDKALERYQVARAFAPDDHRPPYNRGLIMLNSGRYDDAVSEFTEALKLNPTHADSYFHRAIARMWPTKPDLPGAADDFSLALKHGIPPIQGHLMRARVFDRLKDPEAAARDRAAAKDLKPSNERDYVARGCSLMAKDPAGALADFAKAAELNPQYLPAWQNQAYVLSDLYHQPLQALDVQDRAVNLGPDFALAWSGRAVLRARVGQRDGAHTDAQRALHLSEDPQVVYQAACVYALTSATDPDDREIALRLLRRALRDGYRDFTVIESDPDLKPIQNLREFKDAVAAAKTLVN